MAAIGKERAVEDFGERIRIDGGCPKWHERRSQKRSLQRLTV